ERGRSVIGELVAQPAMLRARLIAAWERLTTHPHVDPARTAAIGHCFGGLAALELARSGSDVRRVGSFHGGLAAGGPAGPPGRRAQTTCALECWSAPVPATPSARAISEPRLKTK